MIKGRQGFTLLELMIVVAIVAIASTLAFPSFESYTQRAKLKKAGRNLYSDFQRTRINALRDNKAYGMQFDSAGYKILDLGADNNWDGGDDTVLKTVVLSEYGPITFGAGSGIGAVPDDTIGIGSGVNFTDNKARLTGSIDTDSATTQNFVYLMNTKTDETMAIQVSSTTGRLKLWANWNSNWEDQ